MDIDQVFGFVDTLIFVSSVVDCLSEEFFFLYSRNLLSCGLIYFF